MATADRQLDLCCPPKAELKERPLLSPIQPGGLASVFKVLAKDTRLRMLHALVRAGEMAVTDLAQALGIKPRAVSNQLQRLSDLAILTHWRVGKNIISRVVDSYIPSLLDQGLSLMEDAIDRRNTRPATNEEEAVYFRGPCPSAIRSTLPAA